MCDSGDDGVGWSSYRHVEGHGTGQRRGDHQVTRVDVEDTSHISQHRQYKVSNSDVGSELSDELRDQDDDQ